MGLGEVNINKLLNSLLVAGLSFYVSSEETPTLPLSLGCSSLMGSEIAKASFLRVVMPWFHSFVFLIYSNSFALWQEEATTVFMRFF